MAQTEMGATKVAAQKSGLTVEEYSRRISDGFKKCTYCKQWISKYLFKVENSRHDKLSSVCESCRKIIYHKNYKPKQKRRGKRYTLPRDNDKKQARGRVNHLIRMGLLDNPNDVPCLDCGHFTEMTSMGGCNPPKTDKTRHEYDHYLGYESKNHEKVQAVCSSCHHKRRRFKYVNEDSVDG